MDRLSVGRVEEILEGAGHVRVLVIGDLMLDRYVIGSVERISPEAPVPVVRVEQESAAVGGAGNVATNVTSLGAGCEMIACVGDDHEAQLLRTALGEGGVGTDGLISIPDRPTTVKTRVLARRQQVVRVDREVDGDIPEEVAQQVVEAIREQTPECQVIAIEDYNKGLLVPTVLGAALGRGDEHHLQTVVDPKRLRFFEFAGCTVFKPNAKELADAVGEHVRPDDPRWMEATRERLQCDHLLLTLGERGVALSTGDGGYERLETVARSVYDVSGAGDTVTAVTAVCLGAGATVVEAAILANHAAALGVAKAGVASVSASELLEHYRDYVDR